MKRMLSARVEGPAASAGAAGAAVGAGVLVSYITDGFGWVAALVVALGLFMAFGTYLPERVAATRAGALLDSEWRLALLALILLVASFLAAAWLGATAGFVVFGAAAIALLGAVARGSARHE